MQMLSDLVALHGTGYDVRIPYFSTAKLQVKSAAQNQNRYTPLKNKKRKLANRTDHVQGFLRHPSRHNRVPRCTPLISTKPPGIFKWCRRP